MRRARPSGKTEVEPRRNSGTSWKIAGSTATGDVAIGRREIYRNRSPSAPFRPSNAPTQNNILKRIAILLWLAFAVPSIAYAAVPYEVEFVPTADDALNSAVKDASQLESLADKEPDSEATLRSRAATDRDRLNQVARAYGYYDANIDIRINTKDRPAKATVTVAPGEQYVLASVAIEGVGGRPLPPGSPGIDPADIDLKIGGPALAAPVAAANAKIERAFQKKGFPFARLAQRKVTVDHGTRRMEVRYQVDPGPSALFGPTTVSGLTDLDQAYVQRRLEWRMGEIYDLGLVDKTRDSLVASNLFSTVSVAPAEKLDPKGAVPMLIDLTERPPRSVSAGASYASTEGVSVNASWEHRNLFGDAEDLKLSLIGGQEESAARAEFRKPDYWGKGWDLVSSLAAVDEHAIAYTSKRARLFGGVEYKGFNQIALGGGIAFEHGLIDDFGFQQHYTLIGIPLYARRDTSDDLLNPSRGDREEIQITPYTDPLRSRLTFLSGKLKGSIYRQLGPSDRYILAAYGAVGATFGVDLNDLPKDKRWYAGGGGSVRGYGFQLAGPLGSHDQPLGGLSSLEMGIELRYKLTRTIGIVPFLDAGNVYASELPDPSRRLFIGTGIGVRYYTGIGPIRLDLATPLRSRNVDRPIQIYVGLGQAF
jgi:translocation and assembly module TamA